MPARAENAQNCLLSFLPSTVDCQSGSFVIQRNGDKLSTRRFDVGVFTQAGPKADIGQTRPSSR
jgi:hypothetical protein